MKIVANQKFFFQPNIKSSEGGKKKDSPETIHADIGTVHMNKRDSKTCRWFRNR
jgi:hypothetical protein